MPRNRSEKDTPRLKALRAYGDAVYETRDYIELAKTPDREALKSRRTAWTKLRLVAKVDYDAMAFKSDNFRISYCDEQLNQGIYRSIRLQRKAERTP